MKTHLRWIFASLIIIFILAIFIAIFTTNDIHALPTPNIRISQTAAKIPATPTSQNVRPVDYFVSRDGDNKNDGSLEKPWKTIQFAIDHVQPGDTIHIRAGIYPEVIRISRSGTEKAPITLTSYALEEVVIDGADKTTLRGLRDVSYWIVEDLTFKGTGRYTLVIGWWDDGLTSHWTIRNNNIYGANFIRGTYHVWENNNISGEKYSGTQGDAGISEGAESHHNIYRNNHIHDFSIKDARGIWSQGDTHDSVFENNLVTNIMAKGSEGLGQCIDLDGASKVEWRHTIRGNRLTNCSYAGIQLENVFNSTVENNLINNANSAGIIIINYGPGVGCMAGGETGQYGNGSGDCRGVFTNNVIRQNIIANSGTVGGIVSYEASGVMVFNNIIYRSTAGIFLKDNADYCHDWDVQGNIFSENRIAAFSLVSQKSLRKDSYNLINSAEKTSAYLLRGNPVKQLTLAAWQKSFNLGQGSKEGNPLFIDPTLLNFHLEPGSPAIDSGVDPGITTDFDNRSRLSGSFFDIGPLEKRQ
jgi:hypothetical protein